MQAKESCQGLFEVSYFACQSRFIMSFEQLNKIIRQGGALLSRSIFVLLFAHSLFAERLPVKTYTVADGLLRDNVVKIKQDSRGFLWFCTAEGISRFDGERMMNFTVADGLPERFVNDFLETKGGTIYIATDKGLARFNPYGLRGSTENPLFTVVLPKNPKAEKILILDEEKAGRIWVGTSDGLYKLIETDGRIALEVVSLGEPLLGLGGAIAAPAPNTIYVKTLLEDRQGTLWIGTFGSGLFRLSPDGNIRRFTTADGFGDNKITALFEDRRGRILMGLRSDELGGICMLDATSDENLVEKCYTTKDGLGSNWIRDILETSDGELWLATVFGLCHWQGENSTSVCKTYSSENDLCDDILTLAEDKDGNLWTGSPCGAQKIARYGFTTYGTADGLDDTQVNSVFENSSGELFVTAFPKTKRVLSRFDGDKFSSVKASLPAFVNYHGWGWQQTVRQDHLGAWWIPTGKGLFRSTDSTSFENLARAALVKVETGAKEVDVFRLFEDSRGDVWIATTGEINELWRWERAKNIWHDVTVQVGFSAYRVGSAFAEDKFGNVWIGASSDHGKSALIRYGSGRFNILSESSAVGNGLSSKSEDSIDKVQPLTAADGSVKYAPSGWIRDLFFDSRERLWIASTGDGLWRLDDSNADKFEFIKYTTANGLTSNATASVTEDEFGRIYVGTWRGIDRLNSDTGQIENFTTADGLPASFVEIAFRDRKNNLWFGTGNGLARFVPEPPRTRQPPTILITGLRVEGESQKISILGETLISDLDLSAEKHQISVDFLGLGSTLGEKLKYEYRFGNSDWTQTNERTVNFANLAAGEYRFEIHAETADRIYSKSAIVGFKIATPIWQRWWFVAAFFIFTVFMIYGFYRFRVSRLLEVANMRTRIATDLHDDIGANLTKISILSEVVNQKLNRSGANSFDGSKLLENIAETSRESVSAMSDIVWAINPKKDSLADLTIRMRRYAEEILERRDIRLEFNTPSSVPDLNLNANLRRNIYLIFKESLTNIVRHAEAAMVEIDFRSENGKLILSITDNGRGFDKTVDFDGNGLLNMKKRAAELKGNLRIDSTENKGTTIVLILSRSELRL